MVAALPVRARKGLLTDDGQPLVEAWNRCLGQEGDVDFDPNPEVAIDESPYPRVYTDDLIDAKRAGVAKVVTAILAERSSPKSP